MSKYCPACTDGIGCIFPKPCPPIPAVEKAVREEREAILRYLRRWDISELAGEDITGAIERGEHRK